MADFKATQDTGEYDYANYDGCTESITVPIGYIGYLASNPHLLRSSDRAVRLLKASLKTIESVLPPVAVGDPNYDLYFSKLPPVRHPPIVVHVDLGDKFYLDLIKLMEILHQGREFWSDFADVYTRFVLMLARDVRKEKLEALFESDKLTPYQQAMLKNPYNDVAVDEA